MHSRLERGSPEGAVVRGEYRGGGGEAPKGRSTGGFRRGRSGEKSADV